MTRPNLRIGFGSDGAVKRLRDKISSVRYCLRHCLFAIPVMLKSKCADNRPVRELRLRCIGLSNVGRMGRCCLSGTVNSGRDSSPE
jgi:hypothetical protein